MDLCELTPLEKVEIELNIRLELDAIIEKSVNKILHSINYSINQKIEFKDSLKALTSENRNRILFLTDIKSEVNKN